MFFKSVTEDEYVIKIYMNVSPDYVLECEGHYPLECCRGIAIPLHYNIAYEHTKYVRKG